MKSHVSDSHASNSQLCASFICSFAWEYRLPQKMKFITTALTFLAATILIIATIVQLASINLVNSQAIHTYKPWKHHCPDTEILRSPTTNNMETHHWILLGMMNILECGIVGSR